jgi:hypothetical protein
MKTDETFTDLDLMNTLNLTSCCVNASIRSIVDMFTVLQELPVEEPYQE